MFLGLKIRKKAIAAQITCVQGIKIAVSIILWSIEYGSPSHRNPVIAATTRNMNPTNDTTLSLLMLFLSIVIIIT